MRMLAAPRFYVPSPTYSGERVRVRADGKDEGGRMKDEEVTLPVLLHPSAFILHPFLPAPLPWPSPPSTGERGKSRGKGGSIEIQEQVLELRHLLRGAFEIVLVRHERPDVRLEPHPAVLRAAVGGDLAGEVNQVVDAALRGQHALPLGGEAVEVGHAVQRVQVAGDVVELRQEARHAGQVAPVVAGSVGADRSGDPAPADAAERAAELQDLVDRRPRLLRRLETLPQRGEAFLVVELPERAVERVGGVVADADVAAEGAGVADRPVGADLAQQAQVDA